MKYSLPASATSLAAIICAFFSSLALSVEKNRVEVFPDEVVDSTETIETPEITVLGQTGSAKKSVQDYVPTVSELSGLKLEKKKQSTLGETLSREAGVSSSFFGPNASRPVIRGLEGERVRILQNSLGVLDASGTSPDHAVSIDPLLTERIEVVRGSAALLYGNSAVGGVVNVINGRIPDRLEDRLSLLLDSRGSSADLGRSGGAVIKGSAGQFTFRLDGTVRGANDYSVPGFARSTQLRESQPLAEGESEARGKVLNSANNTFDTAAGASIIGDTGHFGASLSVFGTQYGTVAEPDVRIDMSRYRLELGGEKKSDGFIQSTRFKAAGSFYQHKEMEGEDVATTFTNRGAESRLDFKHASLGGVEGVFGAQQQYSLFGAVGEEAFLPGTTNTSYALFAYEELPLGSFTPTLGLRLDRSGSTSEASERFGAAQSLDFWTPSVSAGILYRLDEAWTLGLSTSFTERAPNYQELFAAGPHAATGIFEVGSTGLRSELGRSAELSLRHKTRTGEGRVSAFAQNFSRFIALSPTGETDADSSLPIYEYRAVSALLAGAEFEYRQGLPWRVGKGGFEAGVVLDFVRGLNLADTSSLPRMPTVRETLALSYKSSAFSTELEVQRSEAQTFVATNELPTDAYTMVNWGAEVPVSSTFGKFNILGRVNNIFNVEARNSVSFLKDIAALPGVNAVVGFRAQM